MTSFARRERHQLCDLLDRVGEAAPTLCGEWTTKDLVVHLLVRERSLLGAPGILVRQFQPLTERVSARVARADYALLVDQLRKPLLSWAAIPAVDAVANAAEFYVHHEDVRRAQPEWAPRTLDADDQQVLWRIVSTGGKTLVRAARVPVVAVDSLSGRRTTLRPGGDPAVVSGPPGELLLFLYGRERLVDLEFDGPEEHVTALRSASFGV